MRLGESLGQRGARTRLDHLDEVALGGDQVTELPGDGVHPGHRTEQQLGVVEIVDISVGNHIARVDAHAKRVFGAHEGPFRVEVGKVETGTRRNEGQRAAAVWGAGSRVKSAMKSWLLRSVPRLFEVHISFLPSGLMTGRPSKPSW